MAKYRVAVVGCGARSRPHIQAHDAIAETEVVACCAPAPTRREKVAAQFGLRAYDDARKMIEAEKPDLVHLVTWPDTRVELMTLVSDLGVPVCTVEKPIAREVSDWRALCELEAVGRTKFAVCHQCRWLKEYLHCREAVASGRLGRVALLDFSAGMNVSGQGTHILNYAMGFVDNAPVARVFGAASGDKEMTSGHPGPDSTVGYLTFENGTRALWNNGPTAPRCGDPKTVWQHVRAGAYAERGHVEWQQFRRWEILSPDGVEAGDFGGMEAWPKSDLQAQTDFHRAMLTWLEDDAQVPGTNLKQSLHEWKVVLALYASALRRRPVEMAEFDPPADLFPQLAAALKG